MPKVSIIVPAYNASDYIVRCLQSVLHQTEADIEVLVFNDASKDATAYKIQKFAARDPRVVFIDYRENQGNAKLRNSGVRMATADYILFVDADDWIELDLVKTVYDRAQSSLADMVVFGYTEHLTYIHNKRKNEFTEYPRLEDGLCKEELMHCLLLNLRGMRMQPWVYLFKKELLIRNNVAFDESGIFFEDVIFAVKALHHSGRVVSVPKSFYHYIRHQKSITHTYGRKSIESRFAALYSVRDFFKQEGCYEVYKDAYTLLFLRFGYIFSALDFLKLEKSHQDQELEMFVRDLMSSKILASIDISQLRLPKDDLRDRNALSYTQLNGLKYIMHKNFTMFKRYYTYSKAFYEWQDRFFYKDKRQ